MTNLSLSSEVKDDSWAQKAELRYRADKRCAIGTVLCLMIADTPSLGS